MGPIRRKQLVGAAISAIHQYGFANATVARIAKRAGVSSGIVHHYFADKDELLFATMRSLLAELRRDTVARQRSARTPRERVNAVIDASLPMPSLMSVLGLARALWQRPPFRAPARNSDTLSPPAARQPDA
jgi:TetR/AcrR family transcriptional repressor of bet genes